MPNAILMAMYPTFGRKRRSGEEEERRREEEEKKKKEKKKGKKKDMKEEKLWVCDRIRNALTTMMSFMVRLLE